MTFPVRDHETNLVNEHYAVVYTPTRQRTRFPDNCVFLHQDMDEAMDACDPEKHFYAAKVIGPSRSSEGYMLYYLVHWLSE
jgi:hypothetical protein